MAQESVTKEINGKIVIFSGVDSLLKEKFEKALNSKVERGVSLEQIREEMAKFGWTSRIDEPYIINTGCEYSTIEQPPEGQPAWPLKEREQSFGEKVNDIVEKFGLPQPEVKVPSKRGRKASPKMELALKYYAEHS